MSRPGRLLAWGSLAALLLLAGCGSPASTGATPAGRSTASADSAAIDHLASARPGRIRLHGRVAFAADRHRNVDLYLVELPRAGYAGSPPARPPTSRRPGHPTAGGSPPL